MKKILAVLIALILPIISFADEIFIPVELWLGANISQSEKIAFPEVSFKFGYKERHKIKGPIIWKNSKTNLPASYLSGKLAAKNAIKAGVSSAVLDIGRITPISGNRAFAVLKGLVDGGLEIPHSESSYPSGDRINGSHISEKVVKDFDKVSKKMDGKI